jgi:twinkle protein
MKRDEGEFIRHDPCPECRSGDALAVYDSGTAYCFSCSTYIHKYEEQEQIAIQTGGANMTRDSFVRGEYLDLNARKVSKETCRKYGYHVADVQGVKTQIADYCDSKGELVGQKVRYADKTFKVRGEVNTKHLFGRHLWRDKGKQVIICEGEIDCLSVAEAFGAKYPIVSLPNGAQSAERVVKNNLEWLEGFGSVLLWFDNDTAGKEAVEKVVPLLTTGKVKVITTGYKDANDVLINEGKSAVVSATYEASEWRPDGILRGADLFTEYKEKQVFAKCDYPYPKLNEMFKGLRKGELVTFTAGSGMGKSTVVREIAYDLMLKQEQRIGYVALEENWRRTLTSFLGMYVNKPLYYDDELTPEEEKEAWDETIGKERLYLYDHFGSIETENLLNKIRVMVKTCGVDYIVLDHVSIVVSGMDTFDERKAIDKLMTDLRSLVEETQVGMLIISHLRRTGENKNHEDGAQISLGQLRGSGAIAQLSDAVIGLERDAQHEEDGDTIRIRVLKNRFAGTLGQADTLRYDHVTGRIDTVLTVEEEEIDFDNPDF